MPKTNRKIAGAVEHQSAHVLLAAVFAFLRRNGINDGWIGKCAREQLRSGRSRGPIRQFRSITKAYEEMGTVLATWFANPRYLDASGQPVSLTVGRGPLSVGSLVKASRVRIPTSIAIKLLQSSSSVRFERDGRIRPTKRVFVLKGFEMPRAALVIQRFLETLRKNSSPRLDDAKLLLERNCHVSEVDIQSLTPVLRDIKERGSAFMDSIDGEIESRRVRKGSRKSGGEMGVLIFAWTRAGRVKKPHRGN
jgi:hypothetical protein